jgi:hypothetical protein
MFIMITPRDRFRLVVRTQQLLLSGGSVLYWCCVCYCGSATFVPFAWASVGQWWQSLKGGSIQICLLLAGCLQAACNQQLLHCGIASPDGGQLPEPLG